jgi:hypothetical protein
VFSAHGGLFILETELIHRGLLFSFFFFFLPVFFFFFCLFFSFGFGLGLGLCVYAFGWTHLVGPDRVRSSSGIDI